jgi:peptide/nickel transport system permease protein
MSYVRYLARRAMFAVLSVYVAVTAMFVLANFMWQWYLSNILAQARYGGATEEQIARMRRQFKQERGLDEPLVVRYVDWLVDITTLNLGTSFEHGKPVVEVLAGPVVTTLTYVLPGVALAVAFGVVVGLFAALSKDSTFDWTVRLGAYTLFAIPAFAIMDYTIFGVSELVDPALGALLATEFRMAFAAVIVAASLLAGQVRFARSSSLEQAGQEFVKLLHAKGTSRLNVAKHILRNASLPIVSLSTSEIVSVLALDIYLIEFIFGIPGVADIVLAAVETGDVPILIWSTMVIVAIGIVGNLLTDVLYGYLDPRIRAS